jgi:hypothetical protein
MGVCPVLEICITNALLPKPPIALSHGSYRLHMLTEITITTLYVTVGRQVKYNDNLFIQYL